MRSEQNEEFNKTVAVDREKAASTNSNNISSIYSGSSFRSTESGSGSPSTKSVLSPNRLREKQFHVLQKNTGLSEDLESSRSALYDKRTVKFTIRRRCLYDDVMKKMKRFLQSRS